jgi:hypothetical protein
MLFVASRHLDEPTKVGIRTGLIQGLSLGGNNLVEYCTWAGALYYGAWRVATGHYTGGQVLNIMAATLIGGFSLGQVKPLHGSHTDRGGLTRAGDGTGTHCMAGSAQHLASTASMACTPSKNSMHNKHSMDSMHNMHSTEQEHTCTASSTIMACTACTLHGHSIGSGSVGEGAWPRVCGQDWRQWLGILNPKHTVLAVEASSMYCPAVHARHFICCT